MGSDKILLIHTTIIITNVADVQEGNSMLLEVVVVAVYRTKIKKQKQKRKEKKKKTGRA